MELFGTAGIRGPVGDRIDPALATAVGRAVADDGDRVVVGHDGRTTSRGLADAVAAGLQSGGAAVERAGELPTPALAAASRGRHGVMVTASHNPPTDNGLKLFADGREYDGTAEQRIERRVETEQAPVAWDDWGRQRRVDVVGPYCDAVVEYAREHGSTPRDLTVAVDCGNGTAGLTTPTVLQRLGADVRALEANVDGHFPARASKPTSDSLGALAEFVPAVGADLGIAHDGDGDRIVVLDADGDVVHEDTILAILAEHYVDAGSNGEPLVITTPNASERVDERVAVAGGKTDRVALGQLHEGLAEATRPVAFAAEPWKHVHPGLGEWIDAVATAAVLVRLCAERSLDERRDPVTERPYRKLSVPCADEAKQPTMDQLEQRLPDAFPQASVATTYGVRLSFADGGWVLVRPSGTETFVRVYAEHDDVDDLVDTVRAIVEDVVAAVE